MPDYDPNRFYFDFPVWVLAASRTGELPDEVMMEDPAVAFVIGNRDGKKAVTIFTDKPQAEIFAKTAGLEAVPVAIKTRMSLVQFLQLQLSSTVPLCWH